MITLCRMQDKPVFIDPKGSDFSRYRGATLLTPNLAEFEAVVGPVPDEKTLLEKGQALMAELNKTTDPDKRTEMLQTAQKMIADDYVNGFLFELAYPTVAKAGIKGLWKDQPTASVDLTGVSWE